MIRLSASTEESAGECAMTIAGWLSRAIETRGRASMAVSGGSTPRLLFDALVPLNIEWSLVDLFFVDERCVPPEHEHSNYALALRHLIGPAGVPQARVHRMRGEDDPQQAADSYADEIRTAVGADGIIDVIQCGIGDDGHTASLFPGSTLVGNRSGLCAAVWVEKKQQHRITLLPSALLGARHLCVLAAGADKVEPVRCALRAAGSDLETPARILARASTSWFLSPAQMYEEFR